MRLLQLQQDGRVTCGSDLIQAIPRYAILSHTWGTDTDEVSFEDLRADQCGGKAGFRKIEFCGQQAKVDGIQYFWVDTCCINKANHSEYAEAIASMFRWYQRAAKCYVYLADVSARNWEEEFPNSRWHTRGWTLQELLAPQCVEFFSSEWQRIGDKASLEQRIHEATAIPIAAIRGAPLEEFGVQERLAWASQRESTRREDNAYCLQGIFSVFLPLIYGEEDHAWVRLRRAIEERWPSQDVWSPGMQSFSTQQSNPHGATLCSHTPDGAPLQLPSTVEFNHGQFRQLGEHPLSTTEDQNADDDRILSSMAFPAMQDRRLKIEPRHEHTCEWVLDVPEFQRWVSSDHGLLWVKGKPGAGKSTVMAFLYDDIIGKTVSSVINLEFFFSARGTQLQRTGLGLYRSLLNQLFRETSAIRNDVRSKFQEKTKSFGNTQHAWEWQQTELEIMFTKNVVESARSRPVTIFVDALDEAGEQSARRLADYFHKLNDRAMSYQARLKICISCRHYPIVDSRVQALAIVVEEHNAFDIDSFIRDKLYLHRAVTEDPGNASDWLALPDEISRRAQGVFQWAQLVVPIVQQYVDDGEPLSEVERQLGDVPDELRNVYTYILETVIKKNDRELALCLLQWVSLVERPLSVVEVRYALASSGDNNFSDKSFSDRTPQWVASDERMKSRIKALSGGLVEIVPAPGSSHESVRVGHQSVTEFMLHCGLALLVQLTGHQHLPKSISVKDVICWSHARIYWSCLDYLITDASYMNKTQLDSTAGQENQLSLFAYAHSYVFTHAERSKSYRTYTLPDEVATLLQVVPILNRLAPKESLLHMASRADLQDVVQYLLENGHDVNQKDEAKRTALHFAAMQGHQNIVEVLYNGGADLNAVSDFGQTPLVNAAERLRISVVQWLLRNGAHVNQGPESWDSALAAAIRKGSAALVKILIHAGADVNVDGLNPGTNLVTALEAGHEQIAQQLLQAGADVHVEYPKGGPLYSAVTNQASTKIIEALIQNGAKMDTIGSDGSILSLLARNRRITMVELLLNSGADVNFPLGGKWPNALYEAASRGHKDMVRLLLARDADVNANARGGWISTELFAASIRGHEAIVSMLIAAGADVDAGTPLVVAAKQGFESIVRMLIDAGADVNVPEESSKMTPLAAAARGGHPQIEQLLVDAGAQRSDQMTTLTMSELES